MDKRQLVDGCKRGDSASVEALYRSYSGKLMGICRHYVDSQEVAEDLLHDAFIVILSSIGTGKPAPDCPSGRAPTDGKPAPDCPSGRAPTEPGSRTSPPARLSISRKMITFAE